MSLIEVKDLRVWFPIRGGILNRVQDYVKAVDDVSFTIEEGKTYGLVGESGSGKSTIGRAIIGLEHITGGQVLFDGSDVTHHARGRSAAYKEYNQSVQMIFQDSISALNPKKRVYDIIREPMDNFFNYSEEETRKEIIRLLEIVGLSESIMYRYPHEFSGGQRQRIGVARAVASRPKLIIADEPTSALDLSVQAQVLNYMKRIQDEFNLSYLFISHDLGVVRYMSDYIGVMHHGRFVEHGSKDQIYKNPQHIYTKRLLAAIPEMDPALREETTARRLAIEKEYQDNKMDYYDKDGRVYDMKDIGDHHLVALAHLEGR